MKLCKTCRRNIWILGAATIGLFFFLYWLHTEGTICEHQHTKDEYCTTYSFLPFVLTQVRETLELWGDAIIALATVVIAWFTWALSKSTANLWKAGDKTAKLQLQPYVFVDSAEISGVAVGGIPTATVLIKNFGKMPARNLRCGIAMFTDKYPAKKTVGPDVALSPPATLHEFGALTHTISFEKAATAQDVQVITSMQECIYVVVSIQYDNGFGDAIRETFKFFTGNAMNVRKGELAAYEDENG